MNEKEQLDRLRDEEDRLVSDEVAASGLKNLGTYSLIDKNLPQSTIPILLSLMRRVTHPAIKQGVIRALGTESARGIAEYELIKYFEEIPETDWAHDDTKWVIGNSLEILSSNYIVEDLIRLAKNQSHGKARQMIVLGLGKLDSSKVYDTLIQLIDDEDVTGQVVVALGCLGDKRALSVLQPKLADTRAWIRRAAKVAIKKLAQT